MESLASAQVGQIYNFHYKQPMSGSTRRLLARVVEVRNLTEDDIRRIKSRSKYRSGDPEFKRTETIVTCQMPNGKHRNFYAERTENCSQSNLATFLFWSGAARLLFRG